LVLGVVGGAWVVAVAAGLLPITAAAISGVAALGGTWLLRSSAGGTLSQEVLALDEVRDAKVGFFGRLQVTPRSLVIERLLEMTAARIEDLAWAYGVRDPSRRWMPFLADASLVLKFSDGSELTVPCFNRQVIPCLSALRYFAGHVALGWDPDLASSWETNRAAFVASVQARLGRVSGAGGDA
jgi:hypothetical protein